MATGSANSVHQMERLTTCPVCLDKFRIPKVLPCMHTFCLTPCLTNLVDPRARSLRCPECRREHQIPAGGVQAFPSNLTMIGFLDLQPVPIEDRAERCFSCREQKPTLVKCHDCAKFFCTECREPHLRETFYQIASSVTQLRRNLPKISEKIATYEQRVNAVKANDEQIRREIALAIGNLIDQLKYRETSLLTEADVYLQSQLRTFRLQQEVAEVELATIASFCESIGNGPPNGHTMNDADLANIRNQTNVYIQQIEALQAQIPTEIQKLRLVFDNQAPISSGIQSFGHFIDITRDQSSQVMTRSPFMHPQQTNQLRSPLTGFSQSSMHYVSTVPASHYAPPTVNNDQYRHLENLYYSRGSPAGQSSMSLTQTVGSRPRHNPLAESPNSPFVHLSSTLPSRPPQTSYAASWNIVPTPRPPPPSAPVVSHNQSASIFGPNPFAASTNSPGVTARASQPPPPPPTTVRGPPAPVTTTAQPTVATNQGSPRRNYATSTTAARSIEGDDRPIFGARGGAANRNGAPGARRGRTVTTAPVQENPIPENSLQRRGTFILEEPTLPNLPQSGAQRPRDTVNVSELYNVRRNNRARTPVTFTINMNEGAATADAPTTTANAGTTTANGAT